MEALAESNLLLARSNESLVARLEEHDSLVKQSNNLRLKNASLEQELQQANADKTALEQEMHLGALQRSTRRVKIYTSFLPFTLGMAAFFTFLILMFLSMFTLITVPEFVWFCCANTAAIVMFLVIKPTDDALIRFFSGFGVVGAPAIVLFLFAVCVAFFPPAGFCPLRGNVTEEIAGGNIKCWNASIVAACFSSLFSIATVIMLPTLRRHPEAAEAEPTLRSVKAYCTNWSRKHSCLTNFIMFTVGSLGGTAFFGLWVVDQHRRGRMAMPVRVALSRIWLAVRVGTTVAALIGVSAYLALLLLDSPTAGAASNAAAREQLYIAIACYTVVFLMFSVQTPTMRAFIHARLNRLAMAGEAGRAAGVAAMVGKLEPHTALSLARRNFRGLPFSLLRREHLNPSSNVPELQGLAKRTPLGSCDAFISQ